MLRSTGDRIDIDPRVRAVLRIAVVLITAGGWWATWAQSRNMGLLMNLGVPMSLGMEGWADLTSFLAFTGMWTVMMIAMMLPSSYPTLLLHGTVYRKRTPSLRGGTLMFALTYFLVWSASGAFFYSAYVLIGFWRSSIAGSDTLIVRSAGAVLVIAGIYQWSNLKFACLSHCQSPLRFIMEHWRDGRYGAVRMGAAHGFYCFGCCWGLMMVLFVMGIMHLGWMAGIGAFILVEKLTPSAIWLPKLAGLVMAVTGIVILISPDALLNFSSQIVIG